jgi:hypothetical protein
MEQVVELVVQYKSRAGIPSFLREEFFPAITNRRIIDNSAEASIGGLDDGHRVGGLLDSVNRAQW